MARQRKAPAKRASEDRPENTPESVVEEAGRETFPASDPSASTATQSARAVPVERLMGAGPGRAESGETVTVECRFKDHEAAKLAVETLVRNAPLNPQRAAIRAADDAVLVEVIASPDDAGRMQAMLHDCGGT